MCTLTDTHCLKYKQTRTHPARYNYYTGKGKLRREEGEKRRERREKEGGRVLFDSSFQLD